METGVAQHADPVLGPGPRGRLEQRVVGEGQVERGRDRAEGDPQHPDDPRCEEDVGGDGLPPRPRTPPGPGGRRPPPRRRRRAGSRRRSSRPGPRTEPDRPDQAGAVAVRPVTGAGRAQRFVAHQSPPSTSWEPALVTTPGVRVPYRGASQEPVSSSPEKQLSMVGSVPVRGGRRRPLSGIERFNRGLPNFPETGYSPRCRARRALRVCSAYGHPAVAEDGRVRPHRLDGVRAPARTGLVNREGV